MLTVFKCSLCGHLAYSRTDADAHLRDVHPESEAWMLPVRYRCLKCGAIWNHPSDCRNHLLREHRLYGNACEEVETELETVM